MDNYFYYVYTLNSTEKIEIRNFFIWPVAESFLICSEAMWDPEVDLESQHSLVADIQSGVSKWNEAYLKFNHTWPLFWDLGTENNDQNSWRKASQASSLPEKQ